MITTNQSSVSAVRVGLFGGTFNPIHRGHIAVAEEVLGRYDLDRIHFIPSAIPPHKTPVAMASASHRLAMARLALKDRHRMHVSDIEIQRKGTSYTIETLRRFKTDEAAAQCYYFLIGVDAFLEIHTWRDYLQLFMECAFIIMSRPQSQKSPGDFMGTVRSYTRTLISKDYQLSGGGNVLEHPTLQPLHMAKVTPVNIASTQIRAAVCQGDSVGPWVDPSVAKYIEEKGLYR